MVKEQCRIYKKEIMEAFKDLRIRGRRKRQIPNILTSLRLLAPAFILPASFFKNISFVLFFIIVFSITDMLDGYIARKFGFTSKLGRDLDAFCDKVFAGTLLLAASFINSFMLVIFSLEGLIAIINIHAKLAGLDPQSLYIGKVKTVFLFPLLGLSLVSTSIIVDSIFKIMFIITIGLQIITFYSYFKKYHKEDQKLNISKTEEISSRLKTYY